MSDKPYCYSKQDFCDDECGCCGCKFYEGHYTRVELRSTEEVNGIKTCPFCGGDAEVNYDDKEYWITCNDCGAATAYGETEEEVKELWNRRVDDDE